MAAAVSYIELTRHMRRRNGHVIVVVCLRDNATGSLTRRWSSLTQHSIDLSTAMLHCDYEPSCLALLEVVVVAAPRYTLYVFLRPLRVRHTCY